MGGIRSSYGWFRVESAARSGPWTGVFLGWSRFVQPLSLSGKRRAVPLAALCVALVLVVVGFELSGSVSSSLGAILFLPVLAASWLLGSPAAAVVSGTAIGVRVGGMAVSAFDAPTALAEAGVLAALALMTHIAARSMLARQQASSDAADRQIRLRLSEQREEIALDVADTVVRSLYGLTLDLQATASMTSVDEVQCRLVTSIAHVDELCADVRRRIFAGERSRRDWAIQAQAPAESGRSVQRSG